jgi:hypothetical protein
MKWMGVAVRKIEWPVDCSIGFRSLLCAGFAADSIAVSAASGRQFARMRYLPLTFDAARRTDRNIVLPRMRGGRREAVDAATPSILSSHFT